MYLTVPFLRCCIEFQYNKCLKINLNKNKIRIENKRLLQVHYCIYWLIAFKTLALKSWKINIYLLCFYMVLP